MNLKDQALPSISVVIPTYNSIRTIRKCLKSILKQDYPKSYIEIIVVDGGSMDGTIPAVKKLGAKIIKVASNLQNAEYNKGVGVNAAKNEILLMLDHDNIIPHKMWLRKIVTPFLENKQVVGVEPLRFHYDKKMKLMDRYFALIGGTDPVAFYLGKNSHLSYIFDKYNLLGKSIDCGDYYLVKFHNNYLPALGGNGAAIKRKIMLNNSKSDPVHFFHIDVHVDLVKKGFNTYALIKDSIIHVPHSEFFSFLARRKYFVEKYYYEDMKKRRYSIYNPKKDKLKLIYYVIISLTVIIPLSDSIRGYLKVRDLVWFIHVFMCLAFLIIYSTAVFKGVFKNVILEK